MTKYFIEDLDTQRWYKDNLDPSMFDVRKELRVSNLEQKDYWTSNPNEAWSCNSREGAAKILVEKMKMFVGHDGCIMPVDMNFCKDYDETNKRFILMNAAVTEHEFVPTKPL